MQFARSPFSRRKRASGEIIRKVGYQYVKILEIKKFYIPYISIVALIFLQLLWIHRPWYNLCYLWDTGAFAFNIAYYSWFFASTFQKVFQVRYC